MCDALFKSDDIASISASFNADIDILRVIKERVIQYILDKFFPQFYANRSLKFHT